MKPASIQRRVAHLGDLPLSNGQTLPDIHLAYETFGTLSATGDNAVLVLHALTGDAHVTGSNYATTDDYVPTAKKYEHWAALTEHSTGRIAGRHHQATTKDPLTGSNAVHERSSTVLARAHSTDTAGTTHPFGALGDTKGDNTYPSYDPGWWSGVVGPGLAIDTDQYFVVAPNILGGCYGSTGPASLAPDGQIWGSRFPQLSTNDQVVAEHRLSEALGIKRWSLVIGASLGGQRALEWGVSYPDQVERLVVIASGAQTTAEQAAWIHVQLQAITSDPAWHGGDYVRGCPSPTPAYDASDSKAEVVNTSVPQGSCGPVAGLALARQIAHTTYRCPSELDTRFGRAPQPGEDPANGGRLAIQSYLDHAGDKLVARFDAGSYAALSQTMLTFDVGAGRGGVDQALAGIRAHTLAVAVDSDRLFFPAQSIQIAAGIPDGHYREVHSAHGHDGFLIESDQLSCILKSFLRQSLPATADI